MEENVYIGFWTLKMKCTQYGYMDKRLSRMLAWAIVFGRDLRILYLFSGSCALRGVGSWAPALIHLPLKVRRGRVVLNIEVFNTCQMPFWSPNKFCFEHFTKLYKVPTIHSEGLSNNYPSQNKLIAICKLKP